MVIMTMNVLAIQVFPGIKYIISNGRKGINSNLRLLE